MLNNLVSPRPFSDPRRSAAGDRLGGMAARLNPWLNWRSNGPDRAQVLSVADLAECTCPDLCDRDHGND
jgi:hypothetical protein